MEAGIKHEQQLAKVRQWFAENRDWVRLTAVAKRMNVPHSTLYRATTQSLEQQRNVEPDFLKQIVHTIKSFSYAD
jgi:predicted transcriptional regulator